MRILKATYNRIKPFVSASYYVAAYFLAIELLLSFN